MKSKRNLKKTKQKRRSKRLSKKVVKLKLKNTRKPKKNKRKTARKSRSRSRSKKVRLVISEKKKKRLTKRINKRKNKLMKNIRKSMKSKFLINKDEMLNVSRPDMNNPQMGGQSGGGILSKIGLGDIPIHLDKFGGVFTNAYKTYMGDQPNIDPHPLRQNLKTQTMTPESVDIGNTYQRVMNNI
tara:strand:- start:230 stop:781 length:552 start_codon:yes stop_codon:yes gene_type:complete